MRRVAVLISGYASEIVLSILLFAVLKQFCRGDVYATMIESHKTFWLSMVGLLLAVSLTVLTVFLTITSSDFGEWLHHNRAFNVYFAAFTAPVVVHLASGVLIACSHSGNKPSAIAGSVVLLYALVMTVTGLNNLRELYQLRFEFRSTKRIAEQQDVRQGQ